MPWDQRSRRRTELPPDWTLIRRDVLNRDAHQCQIADTGCTERATEVDHIGDRHNHSRANLRAACHHCHAQRTSRQGNDTRRAARANATHPAEPHPALRQR